MQQEAVTLQTPFYNQVLSPMQSARLQSENQLQVSYQENLVFTASREELILMLYDGALRFIRRGLNALEENNEGNMHYNLLRAQKIIHYLNMSLDMKKGQEIAQNLARLYDFINRRISESQRDKNADYAKEAMDIIQTLRQAWYEAFMNNNK